VNASTIKSLTFDKKNDFKIAPGADIYSDELNFDLKFPFGYYDFYAKVTQSITGHPGSRTTSFIVKDEQSNVVAFKNPIKRIIGIRFLILMLKLRNPRMQLPL
jgi:hypothetical protein